MRVVVDPPNAGNIQIAPSWSADDYYTEGASLTIAAQPSAGWKFTHWSGDASGTSLSINVDVNGPKQVIAHFAEGLRIQTTWLPHAPRNQPYRALVWACGGTRPYNFSIISGNLPPGLTLDPDTGLITGTPTTDGTYSFVVRVEDSASPALFDEKQLTIEVSRTWVLKYPVDSPTPRFDVAAAYNTDTGKVLLFGGDSVGNDEGDSQTWLWDGQNWQLLQPQTVPPKRNDHAIAYCTADGFWYMYGGSSRSTIYDDLWRFDGADWQQISKAGAWPPAMELPVFVWMAKQGKFLLYGGTSYQTWLFDPLSQQWQQLTTTTHPTCRYMGACYDFERHAVVAFGGIDAGGTDQNETWLFDGAGWQKISTAGSPTERCGMAFVYDPINDQCVLFGGWRSGTNTYFGDAWVLTGNAWSAVTTSGEKPSEIGRAACWYDYSRGLIYVALGGDSTGMLNTLYSLDPVTWEWKKIYPVNHPPAIYGARMTYDPNRRVCVLFGGHNGSGTLYNDIWEWNGSKWTKISVAGNKPDPRYLCLWVYDRSTNKIVMFGGHDPTTGNKFGDTWEYDPSTQSWSNISPSTSPTPRTNISACYWPGYGVFMFGGTPNTETNDCWLYSSGSWTQVTQGSPIPAVRAEHFSWYDAATGYVYGRGSKQRHIPQRRLGI